MITSYNENSRVKIPALVHFARLGYQYVSLKDYQGKIDADTNIFIDTFLSAINRINHTSLLITDAEKIIAELKIALAADDLGRSFFSYLLAGFCDLKLIDLEPENYQNNIFQIVTELTYRSGNDEFRPDITVLINGLPLAFVEVKKPNNKDGIQAEYTRMNIRAQNKKFRKFINITQLMIFSNNSEYDDNEATPLEGAFYATSGYEKLFFSHFREEDETIFSRISALDSETEDFILCDNNLVSLKNTLEYKTNLLPLTPTNRIITSLFSRNRLMLILKYAFAYVEWTDDNGIRHLEKHVMRYPQFFATLAIEQKLRSGVKKGIIWHTQGSGKTALAYFNVHYLRDFFQKQRVIAKFYFVVDRLDLLTQAADEFRSRGLIVIEVNSKEDFISNIRMIGDPGPTGQITITVVNIQKFSEESVAGISDYNVSVQRVYFLDEAHRSYKPYGSFLSNLIASDRDAIMIALTGTPLIGEGYNTKDVFGAYIHKYYYNRSIADRYTLRLIREGIATTYRKSLESALDSISTLRGSLSRKEMYAHPKYVNELVKYITEDFGKSRLMLGDPTIGGMIVCDSSEQARTAFEAMEKTPYSSALILHDEGDTETRRKQRNDFEKGRIDFLIVYNMLLTGFNAPRLKKLYLGRVIKDHSLLQALTRVNRPYGKQQFGYIVDFADIRAEFDKTNKAYFDELQSELGDAFEQYNNIFMSEEEIEQNLEAITEKLFLYDTTNVEVFSQQISVLDDKSELLEIRHALELYKELFNLARLFGYDQLASRFTLEKIIALYHEICNRIALVNLKESLQSSDNMSAILNLALNEIEFHFKKVSESEMVIADKFRESLERTRGEMQHTLDSKDPEYITLLEELRRLLGKKHIEELTAEEMTDYISELERIRTAAARRNHSDQMLAAKYDNDPKFMRTHKRLRETPPPLASDPVIHRVLLSLKHRVDQIVLSNQHLLDNEPYFMRDMLPLVKQALTENKVHYTASQYKYSETEQQINDVLKYQDEELKKIKATMPSTTELDKRIQESEDLLRMLGYTEMPTVPKHDVVKKVMVVPSWEQLCLEAENSVGTGHPLESIFTEAELKRNSQEIRMLNAEYNQLHHLDKYDIAISVAAGLLGAAVDVLLVGIPQKTPDGLKGGTLANYVRDWFDKKFPEEEMEKLANSKVSKVPYDAQDNRNTTQYVDGLSAYYHRLLSLGHDPLLGLIFGVADILTGRMTTIDKTGKIVVQVMENYADRKETDVFAAIAKQIIHFKSDITTSMGLPAPMMALFNLLQFGKIGEYEQTIAEIVQGMYYEGYDFIHFCTLSIPVMIVEVVTRIGYAFKRIKEGHSVKESIPFSLNREKHPKLATMLFIGHSAATAVNAGKVYFTQNPMAINYPQWIAFAKYSYQQLKWVLLDKPNARDAYVRGILYEELNEVIASVDTTFDDMTADYIVVFE